MLVVLLVITTAGITVELELFELLFYLLHATHGLDETFAQGIVGSCVVRTLELSVK